MICHRKVNSLLIFSALSIFLYTPASGQEKYKMSTEIPSSIVTPDKVDSKIGTLKFQDGFPDNETVDKLYDNLDFQRGTQSFLNGLAMVSVEGGAESRFQFRSCESDRSYNRTIDGFQVAVFNGQYDNTLYNCLP